MTDEATREKLRQLRGFMVGMLKYHPDFGMCGVSFDIEHATTIPTDGGPLSTRNWWKIVQQGRRLPCDMSGLVGDAFAFYYGELRLPPEQYRQCAALFFESTEPLEY